VLTTTARLGARAVVAPARNNAVDGAGMLVAVSRLPQVGALVSTMLRVLDNSTRTTTVTLATGLGASAPGSPDRHVAVNWAWAAVADFGLAQN